MTDYDWKVVESSHIEALCWVQRDRVPLKTSHDVLLGDLYVAFKTGSVYRYPGTPNCIYTALMVAQSVGTAFHKLIDKEKGEPVGERIERDR